MQIYWGAVPFVLIQVLMVGMIIAFPGIVSRDKEEKIDLDKVKIEMPTDVPGTDPFATPPDSGASAPGLAPGAAGAATPSTSDPLAPPPLTSSEEQDKQMQELFGGAKK
jgi:GntP family gluconate:H+ symporter